MKNCCSKRKVVYNWNKARRCFPDKVFYPKNTLFIGNIINEAKTNNKRITVVGDKRHTFSDISMSDDNEYIINMKHINKIKLDKENSTVKVGAGTQLRKLNKFLTKHDYALDNMGTVDFQSIGGLIGTATHGSSLKYGSFSDLVESISIIFLTNPFCIEKIDKNHEDFPVLMMNLGMFGIVVSVTLKISKLYGLHSVIEKIDESNVTYSQLSKILSENDHVQLYCFYSIDKFLIKKSNRIESKGLNTVWKKMSDSLNDTFSRFGQKTITSFVNVFPSTMKYFMNLGYKYLIGENKNLAARAFVVDELCNRYSIQNVLDFEYSVPVEKLIDLYKEIKKYLDKYPEYPTTGSIRFVPSSEALLSQSSKRDSACIDIIFSKKDIPYEIKKGLEDVMLNLGARPHWGKWNELTYEKIVENNLYPERDVQEFLETKKRLDPRNMLMTKYFEGIFRQNSKEVCLNK